MNIVVLAKSKAEGELLAEKLMKCGADRVRVACGIPQANNAAKHMNACCVCFDRTFAESYESFFAQFANPLIYFIPFAAQKDNADIIDAINSQRAAYYLVEKITQAETERAVWNLKQRMAHDGNIYIEPVYSPRKRL